MSERRPKTGSEFWLLSDGVLSGIIPVALQLAARAAWAEVTVAGWPRCLLWTRRNGIPGLKKVGVGPVGVSLVLACKDVCAGQAVVSFSAE